MNMYRQIILTCTAHIHCSQTVKKFAQMSCFEHFEVFVVKREVNMENLQWLRMPNLGRI